jgi:hypothetical protein
MAISHAEPDILRILRAMERARRLKAESEYVARAAQWWNREARMDQYAGWRNPERAFSMGSLLADLSIDWFDLSDTTRSAVLHVARAVLASSMTASAARPGIVLTRVRG